MKRVIERVLLLGFCVTLSTVPAWGQAFSGSIMGTVTDNTGAVAPQAIVKITNLATGTIQSLMTDGSGDYTVSLLPPGDYRVAAEGSGFKRAVREPVTLLVDQRQRIDFSLELGQVTEAVNVSAAASQVQADTATVGTEVGQVQSSELPLNGRNFLQLDLLVPGAQPDVKGSNLYGEGGSIEVHGLREISNYDGRPVLQTGGSSSGTGTASSFWAANVGTETGGSILGPSNQNMLVGIKPTVGRTSRWGVIPITADQDSPGPMGRTMTDAAIMLGALESPAPDPNDPDTTRCTPPPNRDYTVFLKADGLKGARIGIPRAFFYEPLDLPGLERPSRGGGGGGRGRGLNPVQAKLMAEVIDVLKKQGAVIVDPANLPSVVEKDPTKNVTVFNDCRTPKGQDADCSMVFKYGMKRDFNKWLASLGPTAPVKTLTELRIWNIGTGAV